MTNCIPSSDVAGIKEYFDKQVGKPHPIAEFFKRAGDVLPVALKFWGEAEVSIPAASKGFTPNHRHYTVAYRFLNPSAPLFELPDVLRMRRELKLDEEEKDFLEKVRAQCHDVQKKHPKLANWIQKRVALLDLGHPSGPNGDFKYALKGNQDLLYAAQALAIRREHSNALALADKVLQQSLNLAACAVHYVFTKEACDLTANLMLPVKETEVDSKTLKVISGCARYDRNFDKAKELWQAAPAADTKLVILAETAESDYGGFYVPMSHGEGGAVLPGAPHAFKHMEASAVLVDDLPELTGFPGSLRTAWNSYVAHDIKDALFLSIPFTEKVDTAKKVRAVLNVNIGTSNAGWRRAYHRQWTDKATDAAWNPVELALRALRLKCAILRENGQILLDSGRIESDNLIESHTVKLLEQRQ
ncbi:MAG TPA: hypothetical protein V6C86_05785 [Oculatellaceae cyanobacterium]